MLVSFKISNFLSFDKEQIFSMVPSLEVEKNENLNNIKNVKLLRLGIILGANSSGKSNLLKAIAIGRNLINGAPSQKYKNFFCKVRKENKDRETMFEYSFYSNGIFYTYGYTINLNSGKFLTEYLYVHNLENDHEEVIFERVSEENPLESLFTYRVDASFNLRKRLDRYLKDFNNTSNELFITNISKDIIIRDIKEFRDISDYFRNYLNVNFQDQEIKFLNLSLIDKVEEVNKLLNIFDTGISDIFFEEVDSRIIETSFESLYGLITKYINTRSVEGNFSFSVRLKQHMFCITHISEETKIYKVLLNHTKAELPFEFFEESDGVRRLFYLFDILLAPKKYSIYVFDELNRCIHPILLSKFVEMFNKNLENFPIQLVFTTHEANILKDETARKDEIWFVEKSEDNTSKLYSLDIFKLSNKRILDAYLDGNYGAIPVFLKEDV